MRCCIGSQDNISCIVASFGGAKFGPPSGKGVMGLRAKREAEGPKTKGSGKSSDTQTMTIVSLISLIYGLFVWDVAQ